MKFMWAKTKKGRYWHAWALFDGYETRGGMCMPVGRTPVPDSAIEGIPRAEDGDLCRDCKYAVMGTRKRYAPATPEGQRDG